MAVLASFLILYTIADVSRTGLCEDSEYASSALPRSHNVSQPDSSHRQSSGEGCFCCSITLMAVPIFQIEILELHEALYLLVDTSTPVMPRSSVYHPPKIV